MADKCCQLPIGCIQKGICGEYFTGLSRFPLRIRHNEGCLSWKCLTFEVINGL